MELELITINSFDFESLLDLMDKYGCSDIPLCGKTEDNENAVVSINNDLVVVKIYQNNGWIRENWYWQDGTVEEVYDGRWK